MEPPSDFDGSTYDPYLDRDRLGEQFLRVWDVMVDRRWRTLYQISALTGDPEQSVSARIRDFRKERNGGHIVLTRRVEGLEGSGVWEYMLIPLEKPLPGQRVRQVPDDLAWRTVAYLYRLKALAPELAEELDEVIARWETILAKRRN